MQVQEWCYNPRTGELSASITGFGYELRKLCVQIPCSMLHEHVQVDFPLCATTAELLLKHKLISREQADALIRDVEEDRCNVSKHTITENPDTT